MTFQKVAEILADYKGIDVSEVKEDSAFADLGLDSLSRVELLARIEQHYGVRLRAEVLGMAQTPRELLAALGESAAPVSCRALAASRARAPSCTLSARSNIAQA